MFSLENETFSQEDGKFSIMYKVAIEEDKDQLFSLFHLEVQKEIRFISAYSASEKTQAGYRGKYAELSYQDT